MPTEPALLSQLQSLWQAAATRTEPPAAPITPQDKHISKSEAGDIPPAKPTGWQAVESFIARFASSGTQAEREPGCDDTPLYPPGWFDAGIVIDIIMPM